MAVLKAVDDVIHIDERVYEGEANFLAELAKVLKFKVELIREARNLSKEEAMNTLKAMPYSKKRTLAMLLHEAAGSDGRVSDQELERIQEIFEEVDLD